MKKKIPCGQKAALAPYTVDIFYFKDKINCVTGSVKIFQDFAPGIKVASDLYNSLTCKQSTSRII